MRQQDTRRRPTLAAVAAASLVAAVALAGPGGRPTAAGPSARQRQQVTVDLPSPIGPPVTVDPPQPTDPPVDPPDPVEPPMPVDPPVTAPPPGTIGPPITVDPPVTVEPPVPVDPPDVPGLLPVPDPLPAGPPGQVVASEPFAVSGFPYAIEGHQVLYLSTNRFGARIAVSGVVLVPVGTPVPDGGRAAVGWAHGTTGMVDGCAPSLDNQRGGRLASPASYDRIDQILAAGHIVAATDYPGLGTPGLHPYLDGLGEGRAVLDSLRAAQDFGATNRAVIVGFSQGGQAAIYAGTEWEAYAPDIDLLAIVPIAAPTFLSAAYAAATALPAAAQYADLILAGIVAARPDLDRTELLTPSGEAVMDELAAFDEPDNGCLDPDFDLEADVRADPLDLPDWKAALVANEPGARAVPVPVLMLASEGDTTSILAMTETICRDLDERGTDLRLWLYDDESHTGTVDVSSDDRARWILDRLDGAPLTDTVAFTREDPQVISECARSTEPPPPDPTDPPDPSDPPPATDPPADPPAGPLEDPPPPTGVVLGGVSSPAGAAPSPAASPISGAARFTG